MEGVFIFDDIVNVKDREIKNILTKVTIDDLTKALIREDEKIRKLFYKNMSLNDLKELDKKLKTTDSFTGYDKRTVQRKMLKIIAEKPEYKDTRFENGFADIEEFEKYLLERRKPEKKYGMDQKDVTMLRFFDSKNADNVLADIKLKNEEENMGNIQIPNTNIQLLNYSICPKCGYIFSFKEISDYYLDPRPDPLFQNKMQQYREDTRVFCYICETYFLPALVIVDGTPKNEVQFLCRIQTMQAIENYYLTEKKIAVLSRNKKNIIKKTVSTNTKTVQDANTTFFDRIMEKVLSYEQNKSDKIIVTGIKNDVLLKEMEERSALITNLVQYTPSNIVLNLIDGTNVKNGDLLFGNLKINSFAIIL